MTELVIMLVWVPAAAGLAYLTLASAYLWVWAVMRLRGRHRPDHAPPDDLPRIAVVIPAHDEEAGLGATLDSVAACRYPERLVDVVVVADNCTDGTAEVARRRGVRCLERTDPVRRGKGYALSHAFSVLLEEPKDAIVVIDADTAVDPELLRGFAARLDAGQSAIQAADRVRNADASPLAYLLHVGNCMEEDLFHEPRAACGVSTVLRGNGMCFRADLLRRIPWDAFGLVEDVQYGMELFRQGVPIHFAPEIAVRSAYPESLEQARIQRSRWATGAQEIARAWVPELIREGLARRSLRHLDAAWSLLVYRKPLLLSVWAVALVLATLLVWLGGGRSPLYWSAWIAASFGAYLAVGIGMAGVTTRRLQMLVRLPFLAVWMAVATLEGVAGRHGVGWQRTPRVVVPEPGDGYRRPSR